MNFEARRPVLSTYIIYCLPTTHVLSLVCPFVECVVKAPCVITVINSRVVRVICNITITGVFKPQSTLTTLQFVTTGKYPLTSLWL